jgi:hypothetical protein
MRLLQKVQYYIFMLDPRQRTAIYGEGALDKDLPIGILIGLVVAAFILDINAIIALGMLTGFLFGMYLIVKLIMVIERGDK